MTTIHPRLVLIVKAYGSLSNKILGGLWLFAVSHGAARSSMSRRLEIEKEL